MLVLRRVAPRDIYQRRVRLNDTSVAEGLEPGDVPLLLTLEGVHGEGTPVVALEPAAAKGEGAKGLVNVVQQLLGALQL